MYTNVLMTLSNNQILSKSPLDSFSVMITNSGLWSLEWKSHWFVLPQKPHLGTLSWLQLWCCNHRDPRLLLEGNITPITKISLEESLQWVQHWFFGSCFFFFFFLSALNNYPSVLVPDMSSEVWCCHPRLNWAAIFWNWYPWLGQPLQRVP